MRARSTDLDRAGVEAAHRALRQAGFSVRRDDAHSTRLVVDLDATGDITFDVRGSALVDAGRARTLTRRDTSPGTAPLLVADRVLRDARGPVEDAGWSWLDRRGELHLRAPGARIDLLIQPCPRPVGPRSATSALEARSVQQVTVAHLLASSSPPGVRSLARELGVAPSTVSRASAALRDAGLLHSDDSPVVPDLFWALAEHWRPDHRAIRSEIHSDDPGVARLGAHIDDLAQKGWVVSGTRGALAWGAPLVASADAPATLYVPDADRLDDVLNRWGEAPQGISGLGGPTVAVAPVDALCMHRFRRPGERWPVAHPLFVALDLAADRARGREILDDWTPSGLPRVW